MDHQTAPVKAQLTVYSKAPLIAMGLEKALQMERLMAY